ncbi:Lrp/AsnC family transcriptional regulator [Brevibacillus fluminis]|uniref:Lrp/AsnC family transcriptional regulator n=1 Tax=Brevibacillus fluminis TaxID=511487 RepID=UPI003F8CEDAD
MDQTDIKILSELQLDSRLSIRELAKRINLSAPSVAERVRKLEDQGIIEGYTIKINRKKMGFPLECFVMLTMKTGEYERFSRFIASYPDSEFCYRIAGDACFLVKLSARSMEQIEAFINTVTPFAATKTQFVFSQVEVDTNVRKAVSELA